MNRMPSSVIRHISFDEERNILSVEYLSGKVYEYFDVPKIVYDEFRGSFAKGTFLNRHIKGKFRFEERK